MLNLDQAMETLLLEAQRGAAGGGLAPLAEAGLAAGRRVKLARTAGAAHALADLWEDHLPAHLRVFDVQHKVGHEGERGGERRQTPTDP